MYGDESAGRGAANGMSKDGKEKTGGEERTGGEEGEGQDDSERGRGRGRLSDGDGYGRRNLRKGWGGRIGSGRKGRWEKIRRLREALGSRFPKAEERDRNDGGYEMDGVQWRLGRKDLASGDVRKSASGSLDARLRLPLKGDRGDECSYAQPFDRALSGTASNDRDDTCDPGG